MAAKKPPSTKKKRDPESSTRIMDAAAATESTQRLQPPRERRRRLHAAAASHPHAVTRLAALVPFCLLGLLLLASPPLVHGDDDHHQQQQQQQQQQEQVVIGEAGEPVPQDTLDTVLWARSQGLEEKNSFPQWFGQRLQENSLSERFRDRIYDGEIEKLNPTCSVIGFLLRTIPVCPIVRKLEEYFLDAPPSLNKFFKNALQPTWEMNQHLPQPLAKYPGDLPKIIDEKVADAERHTVYWYYALCSKAWQHMTAILMEPPEGGPPREAFTEFPAWQLADGWTTGRLMEAHTGVFAIAISKDGHMVILMRGSTVDDDWQSNFLYPFCSEAEAEEARLPGRVHGGFLRYVRALIPQIDAEMQRIRPWKVSLAGDSLGGAVANLIGAYIAREYGDTLTEKPEVIAIGTPRVGNEDFAAWYRAHVNGRSPAFMGAGIRFRPGKLGRQRMGLVWEIGDFVVQVPWDCFPVPDCVSGGNQTYLYAHHGGLVKVLPRMMPNEDSWIKESNWITDVRIGFNGMVATHMCSYWCWATKGLLYEGSNCYFPGDTNHHGPPTDFCMGQG